MGRRRLLAVFLASLLLLLAASSPYLAGEQAGPGYSWRGLPLDDAWIHLVYARSIGEGRPFQYNPGDWETGSTSPLWAVVLAPALAIGAPPVAAAKLLGILLTACAATAGFCVAATIGEPRVGIAFALALPLLPSFTFASISGTEVPLFVFLLLTAISLAIAQRWAWCGVVTGLAILARPEGYILLPLLALAIAAGGPSTSGPSRDSSQPRSAGGPGLSGSRVEAIRRLGPAVARALLPALGVVMPWVGYCLWASGRPLPATFYAKAEWLGLFDIEQLEKIGVFLLMQPFLGSPLLAPASLAAGGLLAAALIGLGLVRLFRMSSKGFVLAGLFSFLFYYALSVELRLGTIRGPEVPGSVLNFYYARYLIPGLAPLLLVWIFGLFTVQDWVASRLRRHAASAAGRASLRRPRAAPLAAAAVLLALPFASTLRTHLALIPIYSWNCENIEELDVAAGKWIAVNTPADYVIGVSDAGAIRYFGGRRVVDLVGLNTYRLLPLIQQIDKTPKRSAEEARLREQFWLKEHVDGFAVMEGWHMPLLRRLPAHVLKSFELSHNTICGQPKLIIYKSLLGKVEPPREENGNRNGAGARRDTSGTGAASTGVAEAIGRR